MKIILLSDKPVKKKTLEYLVFTEFCTCYLHILYLEFYLVYYANLKQSKMSGV